MRRLVVLAGAVLFACGAFLTLQLVLPSVHRWDPVAHHMGLVGGPALAAAGWTAAWLCRDGDERPACRDVAAAGLAMLAVPVAALCLAAASGSELLWFTAPLLIVFVGLPGLVLALAGGARWLRCCRRRAVGPGPAG